MPRESHEAVNWQTHDLAMIHLKESMASLATKTLLLLLMTLSFALSEHQQSTRIESLARPIESEGGNVTSSRNATRSNPRLLPVSQNHTEMSSSKKPQASAGETLELSLRTTANETDEMPQPYMQHLTSVLLVLHMSVFVTGLVGNSLVCLSVFRNKSLQTVTNYYIVNLAVADFLVILICLPPTVYWDLTLTWNFGLVLCKLVLYLQSISVSVSVLTLTCISVDRWYAICRPLEFTSTKYRAKVTIALIWLVSMAIGSPDVVFLTTRSLYEENDFVYTDCTYAWPEDNTKIYQLCIVSLLFVVPFVLMSISYWHIVNVLWRNETIAESLEQSYQFEEELASKSRARDNLERKANAKAKQTSLNVTTDTTVELLTSSSQRMTDIDAKHQSGSCCNNSRQKLAGSPNRESRLVSVVISRPSESLTLARKQLELDKRPIDANEGKMTLQLAGNASLSCNLNGATSDSNKTPGSTSQSNGVQRLLGSRDELSRMEQTKANCYCNHRQDVPKELSRNFKAAGDRRQEPEFSQLLRSEGRQRANSNPCRSTRVFDPIGAHEWLLSSKLMAAKSSLDLTRSRGSRWPRSQKASVDSHSHSVDADIESRTTLGLCPLDDEGENNNAIIECDVSSRHKIASQKLKLDTKNPREADKCNGDNHWPAKYSHQLSGASQPSVGVTTDDKKSAPKRYDCGHPNACLVTGECLTWMEPRNNDAIMVISRGGRCKSIGFKQLDSSHCETSMVATDTTPENQLAGQVDLASVKANQGMDQELASIASHSTQTREPSFKVSSLLAGCCNSRVARRSEHRGASLKIDSQLTLSHVARSSRVSDPCGFNYPTKATKRSQPRVSTKTKIANGHRLPNGGSELDTKASELTATSLQLTPKLTPNSRHNSVHPRDCTCSCSQSGQQTLDGAGDQRASRRCLGPKVASSQQTRFYKLVESRKKAAKMLIVIVIMFGLCYLPVHFLNLLRYTAGLPQNDLTTIASLVSHWLCYFNSAVNPLIYNLMSGKFRHEFANLFFCRCLRRQ